MILPEQEDEQEEEKNWEKKASLSL